MKKLFLVAALTLALGAQAATVDCLPVPAGRTEAVEAPSRGEGFTIKFCGAIYSWLRIPVANPVEQRAYIYVSPDIADRLAGNQLTAVGFSCVLQTSKSLDGSVYVCEEFGADPVTSTPVTIKSSNVENPEYQVAEFDKPYTIKAGQGFYFGYTVTNPGAKDYCYAFDGKDPGRFCGGVASFRDGQLVNDVTMDQQGTNLCMYAITQGNATELTDLVFINSASMGKFTSPVIAPGASAKCSVSLSNFGSNLVTGIDYCCGIDGVMGDPVHKGTFMMSGKNTNVSANTPELLPGRHTVTFQLLKVNDVECNQIIELPYFGVDPKDCLPRKFVVEEGTGTWCGYCPVGIVGMEYMQENYPDFVGIAVHTNDEFEVPAYLPVFNLMGSGVPSSAINRDPLYPTYPSSGVLASVYDTWQANPAVASVALENAEMVEGGVAITTKVRFVIDDPEADYALAYAVTEDGLVGAQTNYFRGDSSAPGKWGTYANPQAWVYTHTARAIYDFNGVPGSVPAKVEAGTDYTYTYNVPLTEVTDVKNAFINVLLLDGNTGVVLNAEKVGLGLAGVKDVTADTDRLLTVRGARGCINIAGEYGSAEVYNASGRLVATVRGASSVEVPAGFYVVRADGHAYKVAVR